MNIWENLENSTLFSNSLNISYLSQYLYKLEILHHSLIYLAVVSNLLFAASLHASGLTPQGKIAAGIILFGWQVTVVMRLSDPFIEFASLSWIQELICLFLWGTFCILFASRWRKNSQRKHLWVYALLIIGATVQQVSETTLAAAFEASYILYHSGDYFLLAALLGLLYLNLGKKTQQLNILANPSWRFILLAAFFLAAKIFSSIIEDPSIKSNSYLVGNHWLTLFSIGFIYYLTPLVFYKTQMHSRFLMELHFLLVLIGYSLIIIGHYLTPINSASLLADNEWENIFLNPAISPFFDALKQAHLTYYSGTLLLTIGILLLLANALLTLVKSPPSKQKTNYVKNNRQKKTQS
ncbi:hypothetical protein VQ643_09685 [Pseudomonas sp. F1_0610]|uniref:hypothetical protein n=1 Tax=Pseudomonas sp. F1_0610 TaxID=3114284 RepID=UPI0039C055C8